jgi:TPR repeat protein
MKRWLWMCVLPWVLAGCVLETFEVPAAYRPGHPGAATPVADGAMFHGPLDPRQGGEITLRFVQSGAARYVVEQIAALPEGKAAALPPSHVHFVPLPGGHFALHWQRIGSAERGYALVRPDRGQLTVLKPQDPPAVAALAQRHGFTAKHAGLTSAHQLETVDEARLLGFFKALAEAGGLQAQAYAARSTVPTALRQETLAQLAAQIPRLQRRDLGDEADAAALVAYARTLAREGNGPGLYLLARLTANGWGMAADGPQAIRLAEAAVAQGLPQAAHVAAAVHYYGLGVPADVARALPYARQAAQAGSPGALTLLGVAYRDGQGVAKDAAEARRWLRRAADAHSPHAHALWAELVLEDRTDDGDRAALAALEAGMAADDPRAHFLRGLMHEQGRGGAKDLAAATQRFLAAAERGDAYSKYLAGHRLRHGQHITQDIPRGRALLAEAAQAGIDDARKALAQPDPEPVKKGCVEDWCKNALAFVDRHQKGLEAKKASAEAEVQRLKAQQAGNQAQIATLWREQRQLTVEARRKAAGTLDMEIYELQQKQLRNTRALLARNPETAQPDERLRQLRARMGAILDKAHKDISALEGKHPNIVAPRLPNGQIVVMRPDGRRVALRPAFNAGAVSPAALPGEGDQWLSPEDEAALLPYEQSWSNVPDDDPRTRRALAALLELGARLDCRAGEMLGRPLVYRATTQQPAYEVDIGGVLRVRERFGLADRPHETEKFFPLSRAAAIEHQPARPGGCAHIRLGCAGNAPCAVQTATDESVRVGAQATLYFNDDRAAEQAAGHLRELVARHASPGAR